MVGIWRHFRHRGRSGLGPRSARRVLRPGVRLRHDKGFTKATGIPVNLDDNSTGPLLTQIEASKNNPDWGLLWADGPTAFAGLDTQHILLRGFEPSVSWDALGTQSLPKDKSYVPTGVTLTAAVVYQLGRGEGPAGKTWQALLSPT